MDETLDTLGKTLTEALSPAVKGYTVAHHELTVAAQAADIVAVMRFLRDDPRCLFWNIVDVTAVDWPGREQRFDVVYHLLSPKHNVRIRVKIETDETTPISSIIDIFPGADWFEREIYDLYGVMITGHPDMRRLHFHEPLKTPARQSCPLSRHPEAHSRCLPKATKNRSCGIPVRAAPAHRRRA